jgi:1,4-alpha-glucan branching enzyme
MKNKLHYLLKSSTLLVGLLLGSSAIAQTNVTFQVDMSQQNGFTTPEVNGTFNSWCGNCNAMTDANGDDVWEVTVSLAPGTYEYKYSADAWASQEALVAGSSCTVTNSGFTNRTLTVGTTAMTLPVVCWQSCLSCSVTPPPVDVTFKLDMTQQTGFTTPEVNGTFNSFCGNCTPMTDANADGIWEATVSLTPGTYEFKYSYDNWAGQETLIAGSPCTITTGQFTNRTLVVGNADTTLATVCFASCSACTTTNDVTFKVNMNDYSSTFTTVYVSGTFNGWSGSANPMTDANADGVWEVTLPISGASIEFKFSLDDWATSEQFAGGESCTVTNGGNVNRFLAITGDVVLPITCYASCVDCVNGINENTAASFTLYPNPANESITVKADKIAEAISITNVVGETVMTITPSEFEQVIYISTLKTGVYFLNSTLNGKTETISFVKK